MHILSDIALDFVPINGKGYPRINIIGLSRPLSYHPDDFIIMEKFIIDRQRLAEVNNAKKGEKHQALLYYLSDSVYMSSHIYMGGYDMFGEPLIYDLREYIEKGIARITDIEADTSHFLYIYRIYYKSFNDTGASSYRLGVEVGTIKGAAASNTIQQTGIDVENSPMMGNGTLYRHNKNGIIIEKGIPMVHVTQRYRGPIESSKEKARRTSLRASDEYLAHSIDETYQTTELLYDDLALFGNRLVGSSTGVGVGALAPEFDYFMNSFLFMEHDIYMNDGTTEE